MLDPTCDGGACPADKWDSSTQIQAETHRHKDAHTHVSDGLLWGLDRHSNIRA